MATSAAEKFSPRIHGPFSSALSSTLSTRSESPQPAATGFISILVAICTIAGSMQAGRKNSQYRYFARRGSPSGGGGFFLGGSPGAEGGSAAGFSPGAPPPLRARPLPPRVVAPQSPRLFA